MNDQTTITIHWDNKATYNRHKIALEIQDACNPRALARELVKMVDAAAVALNSTVAVWDDPAVVLLINKLEMMARSESRYSSAYAACLEKAD